jgi:hypothetical protein
MAIHVVPLEQIIPITTNQSLLFFLSGGAANTNFIVFDLTVRDWNPQTTATQGYHDKHCTTNVIKNK